jgi:hypothetical protein
METQRQISLFFSDVAVGGTSDKTYRLQLLTNSTQAAVAAQYGRRGGPFQCGYLNAKGGWSKAIVTMTLPEAEKVYQSKLNEKLRGLYKPDIEATPQGPSVPVQVPTPLPQPSAIPAQATRAGEPPCELFTEISEAEAERLIASFDYWGQKKMNGRRLQIRKDENGIVGINKKGEVVALPPAVAADAARLPVKRFLLDGEVMGDYWVGWDELRGEVDLTDESYGDRFAAFLGLLAAIEKPGTPCALRAVQTWFTPKEKREGLKSLREARAEGMVFKLKTAPFRPGRNGQHAKFKFLKTLTAKVIPKTAKDEAKGHNSVALGLLNEVGQWIEVGHASTIGKPVAMGAYVEVIYLYGYGTKQAPHLVQARLAKDGQRVMIRDDQDDSDCTVSQVQFTEGQGQ